MAVRDRSRGIRLDRIGAIVGVETPRLAFGTISRYVAVKGGVVVGVVVVARSLGSLSLFLAGRGGRE